MGICVRLGLVSLLGAVSACGGCGDDDPANPDGGLPTEPPSEVRMVAQGGFHSPTDAVASPDGATFYFAATSAGDPGEAAVFSVPSAGGEAIALSSGSPLEYVTGLVLSCDGETLYAADMASGGADSDGGSLFTIDAAGGAATLLAATGVAVPGGLAMAPDCETLFITGRSDSGEGMLARVGTSGGAATIVAMGAPLNSPTGVHVDADGIAWVLDHVGGTGGAGVLFAIDDSGAATVVADGLSLGSPGGVSLTAGGGTAIIASRNRATDEGQLLAVEIASGDSQTIAAASILDPSGLRTARGAGIFAVADSEGDAIFAAE